MSRWTTGEFREVYHHESEVKYEWIIPYFSRLFQSKWNYTPTFQCFGVSWKFRGYLSCGSLHFCLLRNGKTVAPVLFTVSIKKVNGKELVLFCNQRLAEGEAEWSWEWSKWEKLTRKLPSTGVVTVTCTLFLKELPCPGIVTNLAAQPLQLSEIAQQEFMESLTHLAKKVKNKKLSSACSRNGVETIVCHETQNGRPSGTDSRMEQPVAHPELQSNAPGFISNRESRTDLSGTKLMQEKTIASKETEMEEVLEVEIKKDPDVEYPNFNMTEKTFASQETQTEKVLVLQIKEELDLELDEPEKAFISQETQIEMSNVEIKEEPDMELDVKEKAFTSDETKTEEVSDLEIKEPDMELDMKEKAFASEETKTEEESDSEFKVEPDIGFDVKEKVFAFLDFQVEDVVDAEVREDCGLKLYITEKRLASQETQTEDVWNADVRQDRGMKLDITVDPSLQNHLKDMLHSGINHDITFNVRNREFRAHRDMLRARSPVFAAMFKHDTKDSASTSISIDDCDPDTFGEFLRYVYTGRVEDMTPWRAIGLYGAAAKYDFSGLKKVCLQFLEASLCKTSVCDVISLATTHGECDLLEKAIRFFSENAIQILQTDEWQRFAEKNFGAANELCIQAFATLKKQK